MSRGRNATELAALHPFEFDAHIDFDEGTHTYTIDGAMAPRSTSAVVNDAFGGGVFNPELVCSTYLGSWRRRPEHPLNKVVAGLSDRDATDAVTKLWREQADLGTLLHKHAELMLNGHAPEVPLEIQSEVRQFQDFLVEMELSVWRTELSLYYKNKSGKVTCAGQLDLLLKDPKGRFVIIDLKRTPKCLLPTACNYNKFGVGVCEALADNSHARYSIQQSIYAAMFEQRTGQRVHKTYLLQMHPTLSEYHLVQCTDLRRHAMALLEGDCC